MPPAAGVYALCALTSLVCAWLLLRAYQRQRTRLLLWSSVSSPGWRSTMSCSSST